MDEPRRWPRRGGEEGREGSVIIHGRGESTGVGEREDVGGTLLYREAGSFGERWPNGVPRGAVRHSPSLSLLGESAPVSDTSVISTSPDILPERRSVFASPSRFGMKS